MKENVYFILILYRFCKKSEKTAADKEDCSEIHYHHCDCDILASAALLPTSSRCATIIITAADTFASVALLPPPSSLCHYNQYAEDEETLWWLWATQGSMLLSDRQQYVV